MKKKNWNVLSIVMVIVLLISLLAACGDGGQGTGPPPAPAEQQAPPDTADTGEADEVQPADVEEVLIGVLAPLTGPVAQFGVAVNQGLQLYIEQFNARGGLQIRTIVYDEEGDPTNAITGYHHLVDQGVTAIIGSVTSGPTMAVVPIAYEDNMPMITATATHAGVTFNAAENRVFTNMFRSCFIDPFQGQKMADFANEIVGAETVAILYNNEIDYSIGLKDAFEERVQQLGLEIVAIETFQDGNIDFRAQLTNIAAQSPDVLFVPAYYQDIALIGPQSLEAGLEDTVLLGADGWATTVEFMENPHTLEGSFFLTGFSPDVEDDRVQQFMDDYMAAYGEVPNMFAAQAYDAAMILIAAIELTLADGHEPGTDVFKAALIAHMAATDLTGVTGHITFDELNNPQKTAVILEVVNGEERFWGFF